MSTETDYRITGSQATNYLRLLHYSAMVISGSEEREAFANLIYRKFSQEACHRKMATSLHSDASVLEIVEQGGYEFIEK